MTEKQYTVGYFVEPTDVDSYVECDFEYISPSEVVEILNKHQIIIDNLTDENENLKKVISTIFDMIIELDFAKEEYCGALFRLLNEENNDIDKVKKRIEDFLEL